MNSAVYRVYCEELQAEFARVQVLKAEKRALKIKLRRFEEDFVRKNGHKPQSYQEVGAIRDDYTRWGPSLSTTVPSLHRPCLLETVLAPQTNSLYSCLSSEAAPTAPACFSFGLRCLYHRYKFLKEAVAGS